jgi:type 1 glutamine amidotransferase
MRMRSSHRTALPLAAPPAGACARGERRPFAPNWRGRRRTSIDAERAWLIGRRARRAQSVVAILIGAATLALACGSTPTSPATGPPGARLARVIVVTHTAGFRHDSIAVAEPILERLGREANLFETISCRTAEDVRRLLTPQGLAGVDAVAFVNTTGNLGIPDPGALLDWIAAGHGFSGVHSAADTYHDEPAYLEMLGNEFDTHGEQAEIEAVVEAPAHPAVAHLVPRYRVFDEIYRFVANNRARVTPLLTLDRYPRDGLPRAGEPADLPLAWSRPHGAGRVFYTALGHRDDLWRDTRYQQHVLGGIRWTLSR